MKDQRGLCAPGVAAEEGGLGHATPGSLPVPLGRFPDTGFCLVEHGSGHHCSLR